MDLSNYKRQQNKTRQAAKAAASNTSPATTGTTGTSNWYDNIDWENMKSNKVSSTLLRLTAPKLAELYSGEGSPDLYDIPELNFNLPNIQDYMAGGTAYQNAYDKIAPTFWDTYKANVENPLISRFANSGSLGSAVGGLSGSAMDALMNKRSAAENQISSQAYSSAQTPLLAAYEAEKSAAMQKGLEPWKAQIEELQYPYQILPGIVSGTLPAQEVETQSSGGK
jgi:hypothetical protein